MQSRRRLAVMLACLTMWAVSGLPGMSARASSPGLPAVTIHGTAGSDRITLSARDGIIQEAVSSHAPVPLALGVRPLRSSSPVALRVLGGAGSDQLTVDFSGGVPFPEGGLVYLGGDGPGWDSLVIRGGRFRRETSTATSSGSGRISLDGHRIAYEGLEPITDTSAVTDYTFTGTANPDTIDLFNGPLVGSTQTDQINDGGTNAFESVNFANKTNVTIDGADGSDAITMDVTDAADGLSTVTLDGQAESGSTTIEKTPGGVATTAAHSDTTDDVVDIGSGETMTAIDGPINVTNQAFTALTLDDANDITARHVTMASGKVVGLAQAKITYSPNDIGSLVVSGGAGGNVFTVVSTMPDNPTTVNTGIGVDTTTVESTGTDGSLGIDGQEQHDVVKLGTGTVQDLHGAVTVTNSGGRTHLIVDDRADSARRSPILAATSIAGLAPVTIDCTDLLALDVTGGSGGNRWTVETTPSTPGHATTVNTGTGSDHVLVAGVSGSLVLAGSTGNDAFSVRATPPSGAAITLEGGAGNDAFSLGDGVRLRGAIDGGRGIDTVNYSAYSTGVGVNLGASTGTGTTAIRNLEDVVGGSAADQLTGSGAANTLSGGGGGDTLRGLAGNDILVGGSGNDAIVGGSGGDRLLGGGGRDHLNAVDGVDGNDSLNGGPGADTCVADPGAAR